MRTCRTLLLAVVVALAAAFLATARSSAAPVPGSDYVWAQPPAWVLTPWTAPAPGSSYAWAQPGAAAVAVPYAQPPASVSISA